MFRRLSIVCFVLGMCFPSSSAAPQTMMMKIQPISTPNFDGKTLEQVQQAAVLPGGAQMFLATGSQGPSNGVVVSQSPQAGTPILPGRVRLVLTLEVRPSIPHQIISQLIKPSVPTTQVPDVLGNTQRAASTALEAAKLRGRFLGPEVGVVAQQSAAPGETVAQGTEVTLTLQVPRIIVPSLVGRTEVAAVQQLSDDTLRLGTLFGDSAEGSIVRAQSIPPGTEVERDTAVDLTLALPASTAEQSPQQPSKQQVAVPNLLRMNGKLAVATLGKVGLSADQFGGDQAGRVSSQSPRAGTMVDPGTTVYLSFTTAAVLPGSETVPWWLPWIRPSALILGAVLLAGVLAFGTKLAIMLLKHTKEPSSPGTAADLRFVQAGVLTKIESKRRSGPALRFAIQIRRRDHGPRISVPAEPHVFRKE